MLRVSFVQLARRLPRSQVYLIAGPTGSGKTSFSKELALHKGAITLSLDDYFRDQDQVEFVSCEEYGEAPQWDSPSSCDFDLLNLNINELILNGYTLIPKYSFFENRRVEYVPFQKKEHQPIVVEGLHAIKCKDFLTTQSISAFSVFITADEKIRAERIKIRDARERGQAESMFEKRFYFIRLAEQQWILQQQDQAELIIDTSSDHITIRN